MRNWFLMVALFVMTALLLASIPFSGSVQAVQSYLVERDDVNGAMVYTRGESGIFVLPYTPSAPGQPSPTKTAVPAPSKTPAPAKLTMTEFVLLTANPKPGDQVFFRWRVVNNTLSVFKFGGMGPVVLGGLGKPSWGEDQLLPGASLEWEDWITFGTPANYKVALGVCTLANRDLCEAAGAGNGWTVLSDYLTVSVGNPSPAQINLQNGSFETGLADPWNVYHLREASEIGVEDAGAGASLVLDGRYSLRFKQTWRVLHSGIYQQVAVTAGQTIRLTASGYLLYGDTPSQNRIREISSALRVGIDPAGGVDPRSPAVKWAEVGGDIKWVTASVQDNAEASTITVFVEGRVGLDWPADVSVVVLDSITLK